MHVEILRVEIHNGLPASKGFYECSILTELFTSYKRLVTDAKRLSKVELESNIFKKKNSFQCNRVD